MGEIHSTGTYRNYLCVEKKKNEYNQLELTFMDKDGNTHKHTNREDMYPTEFLEEPCSPELSRVYSDRVKLFSKNGKGRKNRRGTKRARRNRNRFSRRN